MKVLLVNTLKVPHPNNPDRDQVLRGGRVHEVPDDIAQRALESGAAKEVDQDTEPGETVEQVAASVELPQRPSNSATKDAWYDYLDALEEATPDLGVLEVADDAKRDDLIAIGDRRVAAWNTR